MEKEESEVEERGERREAGGGEPEGRREEGGEEYRSVGTPSHLSLISHLSYTS